MLRGIQLSVKSGFITYDKVEKAVLDALTDLQVTQQAGQRSGFQMKLTYAKGGMIERELLPQGYFAPAKRFLFSLLVNGVPEVLMDGFVSRYDVAQSNEPGKATLTVTGTDVTQLMDQIDLTGLPMPAMPPIAQVAFILARYLPFGVVPVIVPPVTFSVENPLRRIRAQQGTDYRHVTTLAQDVGYTFYVAPGPVEGVTRAYWGPDLAGVTPGAGLNLTADGADYELVQPALTVNMDQASNVDSLSFTFDGLSKTLFYTIYQNAELGLNIPLPLPDIALNPPLGPGFIMYAKNMNLGRLGGDTQREGAAREEPAKLISRGLGRAAQSANVVGASGSLSVARYGRLLQARRLVTVRGAGPHHDGHYFVKSVSTTLKRGDIRQSFSLSRNAMDSWTEKVAI